jgi:hypothetical protein
VLADGGEAENVITAEIDFAEVSRPFDTSTPIGEIFAS